MSDRYRPSAGKTVATAALVSLGVASLGTVTWVPLLVLNSKLWPTIPWALPAEVVALALIWAWLGGRGRPHRLSATRSRLLRARRVSPRTFLWAAAAGAASLVALAGLWIVLVRITGAGGNPTLQATAAFPASFVVAVIVVASLVSPISEEAAFRGYGQVLLERRFAPPVAIAVSSIFFAAYHGPTQGFAPSKIVFYFLVGAVFGAIAYLTDSVLPALPVHVAGDLLFFFAIWPADSARQLIWTHGADLGFWLNAAQAVAFGALAVWAFRRLARSRGTGGTAARRPDPRAPERPGLAHRCSV